MKKLHTNVFCSKHYIGKFKFIYIDVHCKILGIFMLGSLTKNGTAMTGKDRCKEAGATEADFENFEQECHQVQTNSLSVVNRCVETRNVQVKTWCINPLRNGQPWPIMKYKNDGSTNKVSSDNFNTSVHKHQQHVSFTQIYQSLRAYEL